MEKHILLYVIILLPLWNLMGQDIVLAEIPTRNQISVRDIICTFQDSDGYMWYGTSKGGLYRDDGYTVKAFRTGLNTPDLLESNSITGISEDRNRQIWFGTKRGVYILNKDNSLIRPLTDDSIKNHTVRIIQAASDGSVWIMTAKNNLLHRYNGQEKKMGSYLLNWQGEPKRILALYEDHNHTIWAVLSKGGLLRYDNKQDRFVAYPWVYEQPPTCILQDAHSPYYWVGTDGKGIVRFDPEETDPKKMFVPQTATTSSRTSKKYIKNLIQDGVRHHIWVATTDELYALENTGQNTLQPVAQSQRLLSGKKVIHEIRSDHRGNIWVSGSYPRSFIISFEDEKAEYFPISQVKDEEGFAFTPEKLICANGGDYWFWQMHSGLCYYQTSEHKLLMYGGLEISPTFMMSDKTDGIYILKNRSTIQLLRQDGGQLAAQDFCTVPTKQNEWVRRLHEDQKGNLWIGTSSNLLKYDIATKEFAKVWEQTGIINAVASGSDAKIFAATESSGILILAPDGSKEQYFPHKEDNFMNLKADSDGNIWAKTVQNRVYMYNAADNLFSQIEFDYDLNREVIYDIECDNHNRLWMLTDQKIIIYDHSQQSIQVLRCSDPSIRLNNFQVIAKDKNANIHIGGYDGVIKLSADEILKKRTDNSQIQLTDIRVNGTNRYWACNHNNIVLQPNERNLELFFSTFDFIDRNKVQFAFRYKTSEPYWNFLTEGQNNIYLTELSKGDYELEVRASNGDGTWSEHITTIFIHRLPAWYESWWAFVVYFVALGAVAILLIYRYIGYQRKRQLQQMEEQLSQMKYRFFTNVSHELRTPLTLIITPLESIINKMHDTNLKPQLESVNRNARNLLNIVNQLLDFRKIEMKGEELCLTKGDIDTFLRSVYENFLLLANEKKLQLTYTSALHAYYTFFDSGKLHKVVNNLLSNAIKFTPENGHITLTLGKETREDGEYISISVADTGRGIPENELPLIFEKFRQGTFSGSRGTGSGIGLYLVREYINMHNGTVAVNSRLGKGSEFTVYIPTCLSRKYSQADEADINSEPVVDNLAKTVLIVEDNDEFRQYMKNELNHYYTVYEAANGKEGEAIALEKNPDIIVTDLIMPQMDGLELTHRIKNNVDVSHIPVVLLTANDNIENETKGYKEGADAYIRKPFSWDILLSRIRNLTAQKQQRQQSFNENIAISPNSITISTLDEQLIEKALAIIEKNISNSGYSIEDLSTDMAMSRVTLYRKINSITGNTPSEFVKNVRLKKAAELLLQGQLTVAEVSYSVGFSTPSHFTQSFKKTFGVLPTQYR